MKAEDQLGDFYVPEGETRHLKFVAEWFWFRSGTLITLVEVHELKSDEPMLLRQYGANDALLKLLAAEPDPSSWVRVQRFEGRSWRVAIVDPDEDWPEPAEKASDAM